jgi:hypothetical protein
LPPNPNSEDPQPTWRQVAELPDTAAQVTEYQGHFRTCPCCGTLNHAAILADLKASSVGPRLAALAYFAGCHHVSKRGLEEIAEAVFAAPLALGTVSHLETQMSAALAAPMPRPWRRSNRRLSSTSMKPAESKPDKSVGCGWRPRPVWPCS